MSDAELLGSELRDARLRRGWTLLQAEQQLRIRAKYLEALEQGNFSMLPSIVHTRGFLRNYARWVGLDGDVAVTRYDEMMNSGGRRRGRKTAYEPLPPLATGKREVVLPPAIPTVEGESDLPYRPIIYTADQEESRRSVRSRRTARLMAVVAFVMLGLIILLLPILREIIQSNAAAQDALLTQSNRQTAVAVASIVPTPTISVSPTLLPAPTQATIIDSKSAAGDVFPTPLPGTVQIRLNIVARSWLQVEVDGNPQYIGAPAPGTFLQYSGKRIRVRVANGVGVKLIVNGVDQGLLGARGEIVDQTYTPDGIILPTPTAGIAFDTPTPAP